MQYRQTKHDASNWLIFKIMAAIVVSVLFVVAVINYGETKNPLSFAGWTAHSSGGNPTTTITYNAGVCPTGNPTYTFSVVGKYPTVLNGQPQLGTISSGTAVIYGTSGPQSLSGQNTITFASTFVQTGTLTGNCNTPWNFVFGDHSTYFQNLSQEYIGAGNSSRSIVLTTQKISGVTMEAANVATQSSFALGSATNYGITSSSGQQLFYISLQSNTAGANVSSRSQPELVYLLFNSTAVTPSSVGIQGLNGFACTGNGFPTPSYTSSNTNDPTVNLQGAQNDCEAFLLPEFHNNQYATPAGGTGSFNYLTVQATPTASYTQNSFIGMEVFSADGYYNTTGSVGRFQFPMYAYPQNGINIDTDYVNGNLMVLHH